ncbi:hypothetical protein [Anaerobiospirillum sp. NML02-A-032]|uniref:flagellin N-terminal helical domain-containing protein n=1 Tax=Anaerobiospirillum sp. NML02-A-032 TaxID=2932818 RepID=UPI00248CEA6B|nr:hypothetical protein [Anaerobiospirillum sp. NML02-A-032]
MAQTIEGALDETTAMLQRIRALAVQSANVTNSAADRKALQEEVTQLSQEITRIARQTTFAGQLVLNGKNHKQNNANSLIPDTGELKFQVGANAGITLSLVWGSEFTLSGIGYQAGIKAAADQQGGAKGLVQSKAEGQNYIRFGVCTAQINTNTLANFDAPIQPVNSKRAALGAL